jgi:hypothetical protein
MMCPECITSVAMLTAGVGSAGGVGALVLSKFRRKTHANITRQTETIAEPESASFEEWAAAICAREQESQH